MNIFKSFQRRKRLKLLKRERERRQIIRKFNELEALIEETLENETDRIVRVRLINQKYRLRIQRLTMGV